jgi:hypothetical protein
MAAEQANPVMREAPVAVPQALAELRQVQAPPEVRQGRAIAAARRGQV